VEPAPQTTRGGKTACLRADPPIIRDSGPLWAGFAGVALVEAIEPFCVIDRCAAEIGVLTYKVRGGGDRSLGLRHSRIDPGILENQASFFQSLRSSIAEVGIKLPVLLYAINGKLWIRYGASRVHVAKQLGMKTIPVVLCQLNGLTLPHGFVPTRRLERPVDVLVNGFGSPSLVGDFTADHERIDAHRMEP
jgi:hypothetical protein